MARIFYAVLGNGSVCGSPSESRETAERQLGEVPRKIDAHVLPLTEASADRIAEVAAIQRAYDLLEKTSAIDIESGRKIGEARMTLLRLMNGDTSPVER